MIEKVKEGVMEQKFKQIERHLYKRQYQTAGGELTTHYYAGNTL